MSSINGLLHVGATGLRAATFGVNVASQDASNVNTPGYTRRALHLDPIPGPPDGGGGVMARSAMRVVDGFVERRLLGATADRASAGARRELLGVLDTVFSEDAGNIAPALDAFQSALRELAARPGDLAVRQQVLANTDALATAFRRADEQLSNAQSEADQRIADGVQRANALTTEIASLQREIARSEISGAEASDLRDRRDQRIRQLAEIVPVSVIEDERGMATVLLGGRDPLVSPQGGATPLAARRDPGTGLMRVERTRAGVVEDVGNLLNGGEIGGWLEARDGALASARADLDALASDIATAFNDVHRTGFGLDGASGRNLFSGTTAGTLELSADLRGFPDRLAAATDATTLPGDARIAQALVDLETRPIARGGTASANSAFASIIASAGSAGAAARADADATDAAAQQLVAMRASVSGVSSDEAMISLMQFQRAYEASLKVVHTADEMLQELLQLKR